MRLEPILRPRSGTLAMFLGSVDGAVLAFEHCSSLGGVGVVVVALRPAMFVVSLGGARVPFDR